MKPLSLAHMILGLLLDAPAHGYELRRCLAPFFGAGSPLNVGLFYPALAKLEQQGWVTKQKVPQERVPEKHVYSITATGKREFFHWLERSSPADRPIRYDFFHRDPLLVRAMFFRHLSPERIRAMLRDQVAQAEARCRDYHQVRAGMVERRADSYRIRILDFGLRYHQLRRAWMRELLGELERRLRPRARPRQPSARNRRTP